MRHPVPFHNGVAGVVVGAQRSGDARRPKGIAVEGSNQRIATLVEYLPREVHILDELSVAHRHVSVGRSDPHGEVGEAVAESKDIDTDRIIGGAPGSALFHAVHNRSCGTHGDTIDRVGLMKSILRCARQLGQVPQRRRNAEGNGMIDCGLRRVVLRGKRHAKKQQEHAHDGRGQVEHLPCDHFHPQFRTPFSCLGGWLQRPSAGPVTQSMRRSTGRSSLERSHSLSDLSAQRAST